MEEGRGGGEEQVNRRVKEGKLEKNSEKEDGKVEDCSVRVCFYPAGGKGSTYITSL